VVNEPFHLIYLGIAKTLLKFWFGHGGRKGLFGQKEMKQLNVRVLRIASYHPEEFQRSLEIFDHFLQFKGTQFRCFVLYTGPFLLKDIFTKEIYNHFLKLHVAAKILTDPRLSSSCVSIARNIIKDFVKEHSRIYGKEYVAPNFHAFTHLADNVEYLKCSLENFSAFPFESYLGSLKVLTNSHKSPLEEIAKRLDERMNCSDIESVRTKKIQSATNEANGVVRYKGYLLGVKSKRNFVLSQNKDVMKIHSFDHRSGETFVTGELFEKKTSFYDTPIDSKLLDIFKCFKTLNNRIISIPLSQLKRKLYMMSNPSEDFFVVFPMQEFVYSSFLESL
jgi:hypothetical protein